MKSKWGWENCTIRKQNNYKIDTFWDFFPLATNAIIFEILIKNRTRIFQVNKENILVLDPSTGSFIVCEINTENHRSLKGIQPIDYYYSKRVTPLT